MNTMNKIIELQGIEFYYNGFKAINNISLNINEGVYGLLGPNGAGKTTLIKILLGFLTPKSGSGSVLGHNITKERKALRRYIGYVPENDTLISGMDAVTLTSYLGELSGMPKQEAMKRAHEVLYYVGLEESRYRKADTYSAGMKQRLKLALALVHDPKLLFLDEPTSGMDPQGRKEMLDLIKDIAQKKTMSIMISSHLLPDIEYTCQHVVILNKGTIAAEHDIAGDNRNTFNRYDLKIKGNPVPFMEKIQSLHWAIEETDKGCCKIAMPAEKSSMDIAPGANIRVMREREYFE